MWKSIAVISCCLAATALQAEPELKGTAAELSGYLAGVPKLVTLSGDAEVKVPADRALISLKVITENRSLQEASHANQEIRGKLMKKLADQGMPADRVKPSKFSSTPKYGVFKDKAKSYTIENTVRITAVDEKEFQAVSSLVDAFSEVRYESVEFENVDKEKLKARATAEAIDKVSSKKKIYEDKLGVKLTPKQFNDGRVVLPLIEGRTGARPNSKAVAVTSISYASPSPISEEAEMPTSFNELVYRAAVTVDYALEAK